MPTKELTEEQQQKLARFHEAHRISKERIEKEKLVKEEAENKT